MTSFKPMKASDLRVGYIREVRSLVATTYNNSTIYQGYQQSRSLLRCLNFLKKLHNLPEPKRVKILKLPYSKEVELYHRLDKRAGYLIIRSPTNTNLYHLLDRYAFGAYINGRLEKYKNTYLVYEDLVKQKGYKFTAVRHAISHSSISNPKTIACIKQLFGDERINLKKRNHNKIFRKIYEKLDQEANKALATHLWLLAKKSQERFGDYILI